MNFRRRKRQKVEISMTPMIDAVLFLLFFFIVASTFSKEAELKIKLPEAQNAEQATDEKKIMLIINAEGEYALLGEDGQSHELTQQTATGLSRALVAEAGESREVPFVISADGKTPHQAVITALDVASQLGFSHITFAAKQPAGRAAAE